MTVLKHGFSLGLWIAGVVFGIAVATGTAATEVIDRIVAVVNEDIILLSELNQRMEPYAQRIRQQEMDEDRERQMLFQMRGEMLNRLVDDKLTDQEIKRQDIKVDDAQIDAAIEQIKKANYFTDEDLRRSLEQEQMTMEQYRSDIKEQILRSRLLNYEVRSKIVITDEDIQAYYDSHPENYGGKRRFHLRNILMRVPSFSSEADKQAIQEQMEALRGEIEAGASFAELARTHSQSPAADSGGDIGEFDEETLSPQIRTALDGLEPGQTTAVLDTDQGFQLFHVESINNVAGKPLETVKEEIRQKLFTEVVDKKFVSWLDDLRARSHIKIIN